MRKWNLKKRIALILAVMMLIMNCIPAYAEEIGGDLTGSEDPSISSDVSNTNEDNVEEENGDLLSENESVSDDVAELDSENPEYGEEIPLERSSVSDDDDDISEEDDDDVSLEIRMTSRRGALAATPDILGAGNEEWGPEWDEFGGVIWKISDNKLTISPNDLIYGDSKYGVIGPLGDNDRWKRYKNSITAVEFINSRNYPGKGIVEIGDYAFDGCGLIGAVDVPVTVKKIGYGVFRNCKSLKTIYIRNEEYFFKSDKGAIYKIKDYDSGDETFELLFAPASGEGTLEIDPRTVKIGKYSCYQCDRYSSVLNIPASVNDIGEFAFYGCSGITWINIGKRTQGENYNYESSLISIGQQAFAKCGSLNVMYMPSTVRGLTGGTGGSKIFDGSTKLEYVYYCGAESTLNDYSTMSQSLLDTGLTDDDIPNGRIILVPWNYSVVSFKKDYGIKTDASGKDFSPIPVEYGKSIGENDQRFGNKLYEVKSDNYWFEGWYLQYPIDFSENTQVRQDIQLKMYCKAKLKVQFNSGDGEFSDGQKLVSKTISAGVLNDWPDDPEADGMSFVGWQIDGKKKIILKDSIDNPDAQYFPEGNRFLRNDYTFDGNTSLVAYYVKYESLEFFDADNNKLGSRYVKMNTSLSSGDISYINSLSVNYWKNKYKSSANYVFTGWWSERPVLGQEKGYKLDLEGVLYSKMARKYYLNFKHYLDMTYVYNWDMDGDGVDDVVTYKGKEHNISEGGSYTLEKMPYRPGYEFLGWFNEDGQECSSVIKTIDNTRDRVFTAHWQKLCTITLDRRYNEIYSEEYLNKSQNKHLKEMIIVENVVSGSQLMYKSMIPYDTVSGNWKFAGWYDENDNEITSETSINNDMTLHAKWLLGCAVEYVVRANRTASENIFWGKVVPSGSLLPMIPDDFGDNGKPDPLNPAYGYRGYDFVGWLNEKNNKEPDPNYVVTEDTTFIAQWKENGEPLYPMYTISFNSMGGSAVPEQTVSEGFLAEKPADPTWTDHKFQGWFTDTDYSRQWDFENDVVTENMYLYAKWISWTEEDEDRLHGIYWVRLIKNGKASLAEYFRESGLKYSYDRNIVKFRSGKKVVKGKKLGETRITATKGDGSDYPISVRVFVLKQELQDMYGYSSGAKIDANEFLTVSGFPPDRWVSTKPSVASIDAKTGIITVRKRGRAKIKAYYQNKAVTATFKSEVPKFAKPFYRLKTGQTKKLKIKRLKKYDIVSWNVLPEGSLSVNNPSWNDIERAASEAYSTSYNAVSGNRSASMNVVSNNEIMGIGSAEIDGNGKITALTAGDVIVYAAVYGQIISTKVHIEPPILRKKSIVLKINKTTKLKLSRTKLKNVEWKTSNDKVAYVDPVSGKVYGLKSGRVTLRTNAGGVVNTCSVQVQDTAVNVTKGPALSR